MFKRVFQSITETLARKEEPKPGTWVSARTKTSDKARHLLDKISATLNSTPMTPATSSATPAKTPEASHSPEDVCGITTQMSAEEIKSRLALLYRRYNRATSSLDSKVRAEAESMLDAIVTVREKVFGPI